MLLGNHELLSPRYKGNNERYEAFPTSERSHIFSASKIQTAANESPAKPRVSSQTPAAKSRKSIHTPSAKQSASHRGTVLLRPIHGAKMCTFFRQLWPGESFYGTVIRF